MEIDHVEVPVCMLIDAVVEAAVDGNVDDDEEDNDERSVCKADWLSSWRCHCQVVVVVYMFDEQSECLQYMERC